MRRESNLDKRTGVSRKERAFVFERFPRLAFPSSEIRRLHGDYGMTWGSCPARPARVCAGSTSARWVAGSTNPN
jgi:hypothetical protein